MTAVMVTFWIVVSTILVVSGWTLSAIHELNTLGYGVVALLGIVTGIIWLSVHNPSTPPPARARRWRAIGRRRFGRLFPAAFLFLAMLAIVGGIIHPPDNGDALAYRIPRSLHWLAAGRWHWIHSGIHTSSARLNTRACGFEWLSSPLLLVLHTDRWLFVINAISYLLLPGLLFSVFRRLGVRPRVAWHWMWLLPSAYCFLLQAGGVTNDAFAAVYALAAVDFALRARESGRVSDVWLSILSAGLLAGSKASNLPLLLPWLVAVAPSLRLLTRRMAVGCVVVSASLLVSFLPNAVLNSHYCGDWTGALPEEASLGRLSPLPGIVGNSVVLVVQNAVPTFYPVTKWWDHFIEHHAAGLVSSRRWRYFEGGRLHITNLGELPLEDSAGLGFAISWMLAASVVGAMRLRSPRAKGSNRQEPPPEDQHWLRAVRWSPYVSLLAFMAKLGLATVARLTIPYYALLIAPLLTSASQPRVVRAIWWRRLATGTFLLALVVLVLSPSRPLWPAHRALTELHDRNPNSALVERAYRVYTVFGARWDVLKPVRDLLPPGTRDIGYMAFGDPPEASIWRPFGSRRIWPCLPSDPLSYLRERGIEYIVAGSDADTTQMSDMTLDECLGLWLGRVNGTVIGRVSLDIKAHLGPATWYVIRLPVEKTELAVGQASGNAAVSTTP
jgi:hypothetical protein